MHLLYMIHHKIKLYITWTFWCKRQHYYSETWCNGGWRTILSVIFWSLGSLGHQLMWFMVIGRKFSYCPWWRHQMETFSALLALCAGNSPVPVNSPHKGQWRGALMFSLISACIYYKRLSKQPRGWWFETPSWSLWRHCNALNLDDSAISVVADKLQLPEQSKYLGSWFDNDLNWGDHVLELCRKMYHYIHMFRSLRKILPPPLLITYAQSKID